MKPPTLILIVLLVALAGCGSESLQDQVRSEYDAYAERHDHDFRAKDIAKIACIEEPDQQYDGWCSIHIKGTPAKDIGFDELLEGVNSGEITGPRGGTTFDVPYRDEKLMWGEAGVNAAPASSRADDS